MTSSLSLRPSVCFFLARSQTLCVSRSHGKYFMRLCERRPQTSLSLSLFLCVQLWSPCCHFSFSFFFFWCGHIAILGEDFFFFCKRTGFSFIFTGARCDTDTCRLNWTQSDTGFMIKEPKWATRLFRTVTPTPSTFFCGCESVLKCTVFLTW